MNRHAAIFALAGFLAGCNAGALSPEERLVEDLQTANDFLDRYDLAEPSELPSGGTTNFVGAAYLASDAGPHIFRGDFRMSVAFEGTNAASGSIRNVEYHTGEISYSPSSGHAHVSGLTFRDELDGTIYLTGTRSNSSVSISAVGGSLSGTVGGVKDTYDASFGGGGNLSLQTASGRPLALAGEPGVTLTGRDSASVHATEGMVLGFAQ